ncbi:ROK family protein [Liquorilactobacillus sicerae]|uniref:ROK family protein n=1 Tax=Liquorilactobacillus sicerae TaxID=1416943 RepID=UPI002480D5E9|nr:ROK family protein [Liquorilactobacillus sicerae]
MHRYLSIDIGGTNLKYGLLDRAGRLIMKSKCVTPDNKADFLRNLNQIVAQYYSQVAGIAISTPGKVDAQQGIVYFGGALPYLDGMNFKKMIQEKYGPTPVGVENDGKAGALAELWLGVLQDHPNSAAIILGTGVGGGIILNNQLLPGSHFQAGELSFMVNNYRQIKYQKMVGMDVSAVGMVEKIATVLSLPNKKDGVAVFDQINQGNEIAVKIFKLFCQKVAYLILNIQSVVDLTTYAIGGGISSQPLLVKTINEEYDKMLLELPLVKETLTRPQIKKAKFENSANLYGALYSLLVQLDQERGKF